MKRRAWPTPGTAGGAALTAALGLSTPALAVHPGDEQIHQQLEEILKRPEFGAPKVDFWSWLFRQIVVKLAAFIAWLGQVRESNPPLFWLLVVASLAAAVLLIVLLIRVSVRFGVFSRRVPLDHLHQETRRRLSQAYWEEARRRAAGFDFTEAIRYLFLSLVYRFDESGKVSFQKAYTNREYLELFEDRRPVYSGLKVFVDTLDDHWYGQRATDRRQYENCLALYEQLQ